MKANLLLDPRAVDDIQNALDFYNEKSEGLGFHFENELETFLLSIQKTPQFRVRYDDIRCLPMKRFPFMIHYTLIEEKQTVLILAILHTSLDVRKYPYQNQ